MQTGQEQHCSSSLTNQQNDRKREIQPKAPSGGHSSLMVSQRKTSNLKVDQTNDQSTLMLASSGRNSPKPQSRQSRQSHQSHLSHFSDKKPMTPSKLDMAPVLKNVQINFETAKKRNESNRFLAGRVFSNVEPDQQEVVLRAISLTAELKHKKMQETHQQTLYDKYRDELDDFDYDQEMGASEESAVQTDQSCNPDKITEKSGEQASIKEKHETEDLIIEEDEKSSKDLAPAGTSREGPEKDTANETLIGRMAFDDIAQTTMASPLGVMQLTKKRNKNSKQTEDFKLTERSNGLAMGDTAAVTKTTMDGGFESPLAVTKARFKNMINTTAKFANKSIIERQAEAKERNTVLQKTIKAKRVHTRADSLGTKAAASVTNTEDGSISPDASKKKRNSQNIVDDQVNTQTSALSTANDMSGPGTSKTPTSGHVQLPMLKHGSANKEVESSAMLQFQPSTSSLRKDHLLQHANFDNIQSQSPLRGVGLDFESDYIAQPKTKEGRRSEQEVTDRENLFGSQGLSSTMPPLNTNVVIESTLSSKYQTPRQTPTSPKVIEPSSRVIRGKQQEMSVQEYLRQRKAGESKVLEQSDFLSRFELKDIVIENTLPNSPIFANKKKGVSSNVQSFKAPFLRDVSDNLFDKSRTKLKPSGGIFSERSRSMMNPKTIAAISPKVQRSLATKAMIRNSPSMSNIKPTHRKDFLKVTSEEGGPSDADLTSAQHPQNLNNKQNQTNAKKDRRSFMEDLLFTPISKQFETNEEAFSLPSQVVEQWLDAVLAYDQVDLMDLSAAGRENGKVLMEEASSKASKTKIRDIAPGLEDSQKVADSMPATLRYGIDYVSLSQQGLLRDQITRLHRSLYIYTVGFYSVVREACSNAKVKKNVIVGVMRVYQQLLEKCQKTDWKMLINEVANSYEDQDVKRKRETQLILDQRDQVIGTLKREITGLHKVIQEQKETALSEKEASSRLYESYMILQHHNEANLSLRLATEEKLKLLFKRDRQQEFRVKKAEKCVIEDREALQSNETTIRELNEELDKLRNKVIEKDGFQKLIKQDLLAQKRNYQSAMHRLKLLEKPFQLSQLRENRYFSQLQKKYIEENQEQFKINLLESQVQPFLTQIKLLENEMGCLKEVNRQQEEENINVNAKLKATLQELTERAGTFHSAEEAIRKKDRELQQMQEKLEKITNRMNNFELEKKKLATQFVIAEDRAKTATEAHEQLTVMIARAEEHEYEREVQLAKEKERNEVMAIELEEAIEAQRNAETVTLYMTQTTIAEQSKQLSKLNQEVILKNQAMEQDRKYYLEQKIRLQKQIERLTDVQKKYILDCKVASQQESHYREKYVESLDTIKELETKFSLEHEKTEVEDDGKDDQTKKIEELNVKILELESKLEDNVRIQDFRKSKWKAYKKQHAKGKKSLQNEVEQVHSKVSQAFNSNIMMGEDFRSKAHDNKIKIIELQQEICFLKAEPTLLKERIKTLFTQLRREEERNRMALECKRQEILEVWRLVDGKDKEIAKLLIRHTEDQRLVKLMRRKIGIPDFDVVEKEVQTCKLGADVSIQTERFDKQVGIQAHGFNLKDNFAQTLELEPPKSPRQKAKTKKSPQRSQALKNEDFETDSRMPQKKIKAKKKAKQKKKEDDSNSSVKRLDTKQSLLHLNSSAVLDSQSSPSNRQKGAKKNSLPPLDSDAKQDIIEEFSSPVSRKTKDSSPKKSNKKQKASFTMEMQDLDDELGSEIQEHDTNDEMEVPANDATEKVEQPANDATEEAERPVNDATEEAERSVNDGTEEAERPSNDASEEDQQHSAKQKQNFAHDNDQVSSQMSRVDSKLSMERTGKYMVNIDSEEEAKVGQIQIQTGSLSRPSKFKIENRRVSGKIRAGRSILEPNLDPKSPSQGKADAIPEEQPKKSKEKVQQVSRQQIAKNNEASRQKQAIVSQQMRGLIKSAVNRD